MILSATEVTLANESACRFLDIPASELVGPLDRLEQVHDLDAHGNETGYESHPAAMTLATGVPQYGIERGLRVASGEMRWCLLNTVPLIRRGSDLPYAVVHVVHRHHRAQAGRPTRCCRARRASARSPSRSPWASTRPTPRARSPT